MILTKEVEVTLGSINIEYYEDLGYEIPRYFNTNNNKYLVKRRTKIIVRVDDLQLGSNIKIEIKCDNCEKDPYYITYNDYNSHINEDGKYYCKKCASKLYGGENSRIKHLKNSISFRQWCIDNNRQDILNRWDCELNKHKPEEISYGSKLKIYFKCPKGIHKSELKIISDITILNRLSICNQCNSFAQYLLNTNGENGIESYWSNINTFSPWEITKGTNSKKVWLKCDNTMHNDYDIYPNNYIKDNRGNGCPQCIQERTESILQEKVRSYLESLKYNILHEHKGNLVCINPKTKNRLPYDNEININGQKLIIEVHGLQHYIVSSWYKHMAIRNNTTPEQELHYQKLKDRYKRIFAKSQGYFYVEIPYWTDDKDETWKKLIDEKIKELLVVLQTQS